MFCWTLLYAPSSFAIILMGKRELVALLNLSSWCLVIVVWLFLAVPWVCLQFVIVVFPDHTHLLFYTREQVLCLYNNDTSMVYARFLLIARPVGVHYNHCVSPSVCPWSVIVTASLDGQGLAEHQTGQLLSVSEHAYNY